ncbi:MAG: SHOCT domain-containing protein [Candidatus Competibacteraceae bacterium]
MYRLTPQGQSLIADLAQRYGVGTDAVMTLLQALLAGNGTMAQFNHPEFGGSGQWMQGGMTMVGDMFNQALKAKVDGLCSELAGLLARQELPPAPANSQSQQQGGTGYSSQSQQQGGTGYSSQSQQQGGTGYSTWTGGSVAGGTVSLFVPGQGGSGNWWPAELGMPAATGAQNQMRYAYFPQRRRLAVAVNGRITVYDTLDHQIGGFSQQQSGDASVTFTSQYGLVALSALPVVSGGGTAYNPPAPQTAPATPQETDIFATIERLAELKQKGVLTEEEFNRKKADLLSRL